MKASTASAVLVAAMVVLMGFGGVVPVVGNTNYVNQMDEDCFEGSSFSLAVVAPQSLKDPYDDDSICPNPVRWTDGEPVDESGEHDPNIIGARCSGEYVIWGSQGGFAPNPEYLKEFVEDGRINDISCIQIIIWDYESDPDDPGKVTREEFLTLAFAWPSDGAPDLPRVTIDYTDGRARNDDGAGPVGATCDGSDTDPATIDTRGSLFPQQWTYYVHATCVQVTVGDVTVAVDLRGAGIEEISLESSQGDATLAKAGDTITLWFRADMELNEEDIELEHFRIGGSDITVGPWSEVGSMDGTEWALTHEVQDGQNGDVEFRLIIGDEGIIPPFGFDGKFNVAAMDGTDERTQADTDGVLVDTTAPSIAVSLDDGSGSGDLDQWHNDPSGLTLQFTFTDATSGLDAVGVTGPADAGCDGFGAGMELVSCTPELSGLPDGAHGFTASATDRAGNSHAGEAVEVKIDANAPVTTAMVDPPVPDGPGGWHTISPAVTLTCDDGEGEVSGCGPTEYHFGDGGWQAYDEPVEVPDGAGVAFSFRSTDAAGNVEATQTLTLNVDTTAPSIAVSLDDGSGPGDLDQWHNDPSGLALQFTFTDATSGLATVSVAGPADAGCDGLGAGMELVSCTPDLSGLPDGVHGFTASATDLAGNSHEAEAVEVKIDANAPVTTATVNPSEPDGQGDWYTSRSTVTFACSDGGGSGCVVTEYKIDDGGWQMYDDDVPVEVPDGAGVILELRSTDHAGNVEETQSLTISVDTVAPVTTATADPSGPDGPGGWHTSGPVVTLACDDGDGSGCVLTEYQIGDGEWQTYGEPVEVPDGAGVVLWFRSTDVAGNVEEARDMAPIDVDTTPPQGNVLLDDLENPHRGETVPVGFEASDEASGVASVQLLVRVPDGDGFIQHSEAVVFDPPQGQAGGSIEYAPDVSGFHSFKIIVTDAAGHEWTSAAAGVEVVLPPGDASALHSLIEAASPQIIADGEDATTITVVLRDARQTPLEEGDAGLVCLATDAGTLDSAAGQGGCLDGEVQADDGGDGSYSATLTAGLDVEEATVSGSLDGDPIADTAVVGFVAGPAASLVFVSDTASPIASSDSRVLAVGLQDAGGRPAAGTVVFAQTGGSGSLAGLDAGGVAVEAVDGVAALTVTGLDAGAVAVEAAAAEGLVATASLEVVAGEPTQVLAEATGDGAVADGVEENVLRVALRDLNGNPVPDGEVWVTDDDGLHGLGPAATLTDASGEALFAAASTVSGSFTVAFGSSAGDAEATVVFVPGPMEASNTVIHAGTAALVADGEDATGIVVVASDAHGNPVGQDGAGLVVCLATDAGTLSSEAGQGQCPTDWMQALDVGDGSYRATLTAAEAAGQATVSGVLDGVAFPAVAVVDFVTKKQSFGAHPPPSGDAGEDAMDTTTDSDADTTTGGTTGGGAGGGAGPAASGDASSGPTVTVSPSRAPDVGSWYTSPVGFTASTGSQGAVCDTPRVHSGPDGRGLAVAMACTDEDGSGNGSLTFDYDGSPPTVSVSTPALVGADGGQAVFRVDDLASGVASWDAQYRIDGGAWLPLPGHGASRALPDAPDGSVVDVRARAVDHAGHERAFPDAPDASVRVVLAGPPAAPTGLAVEARDGGHRLVWEASPGGAGGAVAAYVVESRAPGAVDFATVGRSQGVFFEASGAAGHAFRVAAVDALGNVGPFSAAVQAPGRDASVAVEARSHDGGVRVAWDPAEAAGSRGVQVWRVAQDGGRALVATLGNDDAAFHDGSYLDSEGGMAYAVTVFHEDGLDLRSEADPPALDALRVGVVPAGLDDAGQAGSVAWALGALGAMTLLVLAAAAALAVALLRRKGTA